MISTKATAATGAEIAGEGGRVHIIGLGSEDDKLALKFETRKKRHICNVVRLDIDPGLLRQRMEVLLGLYPGMTAISASAVYNCYGLSFAARRTAIADAEDVEHILEDDGYRALPWDPESWIPGDTVLYRNKSGIVQHSAMIVRIDRIIEEARHEIFVLSSWGQDGEYLHEMRRVSPLLGSPTEVVSQRIMHALHRAP